MFCWQVCNLAWSKHASELVSTHGYSQNQILVWKYPSLVQVSVLAYYTKILTSHNGETKLFLVVQKATFSMFKSFYIPGRKRTIVYAAEGEVIHNIQQGET